MGEAVRKEEEKQDIRKVDHGMKAFGDEAESHHDEQEDSTGDEVAEEDENDTPKEDVALSVDERMRAFEKEKHVRKKEEKQDREDMKQLNQGMKAFDKEEHEEAVRKEEEKQDIRKVDHGMKAFRDEAESHHDEQEDST